MQNNLFVVAFRQCGFRVLVNQMVRWESSLVSKEYQVFWLVRRNCWTYCEYFISFYKRISLNTCLDTASLKQWIHIYAIRLYHCANSFHSTRILHVYYRLNLGTANFRKQCRLLFRKIVNTSIIHTQNLPLQPLVLRMRVSNENDYVLNCIQWNIDTYCTHGYKLYSIQLI